MNARMENKLLSLDFCRGENAVHVILPEIYDFQMITDGLVACGMLKPEERALTEYRTERDGVRYPADRKRTLKQTAIRSLDRIAVEVKGEQHEERRHVRKFRRISG